MCHENRNATFEPKIVPKGARRLERFNANIVALYARGLSTRDIRSELARMYGVDVSPALVSKVTDGILEELTEWQNRPLDGCYPILYIDAMVVKVRTSGTVINRPAYVVVGVERRRPQTCAGGVVGRWWRRRQVLAVGTDRDTQPRPWGRADRVL